MMVTETRLEHLAVQSQKTARRYIPIGQGFMVQGIVGTTGSVRTTNNMRVFYKETSSDSEFFRSSSETSQDTPDTNDLEYNEYGYSIVPAIAKRFRVNVDFNNTYKRQLLLNFHPSATDGFDRGLEAKSPGGVSSDASWLFGTEPMVIQAFSFDQDLKIPLAIVVSEQQSVGFSMFDIQNFDDSQPIFIHDMETDVYVNLKTQNYNINLLAGEYPNRFEITFKTEETLTTPEAAIADLKVFQDNSQAQLTILNPNGLDIDRVSLFDTAGKQIFEATNTHILSKYQFATKTLSEGIYIATITLGSNEVISKKVVVKN